MSSIRIKTKYIDIGVCGEDIERTLYCYHNNSSDFIRYYDEDGNILDMEFRDDSGLWDAMILLNSPFENGELKLGVEYCKIPKEKYESR